MNSHQQATCDGGTFEEVIFPKWQPIILPSWSWTPSTRDENMYQHFDGILKNLEDDKTYKVEIKAKSQGRGEWFCIELLNVRGKFGWSYGKADIIIFRDDTYGILAVPRAKLMYEISRLLKEPRLRGFNRKFIENTYHTTRSLDSIPDWSFRRRWDRPLESVLKVPYKFILGLAMKGILESCIKNADRLRY